MKKKLIALILILLLAISIHGAETGTDITRSANDLVRLYIENTGTDTKSSAGVKFKNSSGDTLQIAVSFGSNALFDLTATNEYKFYIGGSEVANITSGGFDVNDLSADVLLESELDKFSEWDTQINTTGGATASKVLMGDGNWETLDTSGQPDQNLFNTISDGTNTYTASSTTDNIDFTTSGLASVSVNATSGEITVGASGDDWGSDVVVSSNSFSGNGTSGDTLDVDWTNWNDLASGGDVIWGNAANLDVAGNVDWEYANDLDASGNINDFADANDLDTSGNVAWNNSECMDSLGYLDDVTVQDTDALYFAATGASRAPAPGDAGTWKIYSDTDDNLVYEYYDGVSWVEKQRIIQ
ncbi:MAG: hypothetical protein KGY74_05230 [Candidatus Cloacimonetes bacterium]|nr:hypothetical protein [Candidatus Cloacimonadota bacterium]